MDNEDTESVLKAFRDGLVPAERMIALLEEARLLERVVGQANAMDAGASEDGGMTICPLWAHILMLNIPFLKIFAIKTDKLHLTRVNSPY
jgi:hypothetical protein